jgi:subtilisin family serine protease
MSVPLKGTAACLLRAEARKMRHLVVLSVAVALVVALQGGRPRRSAHAVAAEAVAVPDVTAIKHPQSVTGGAAPRGPVSSWSDVARLRERYGVRGDRVRVGVISLGVRGLGESAASGYLPATVLECRTADGAIHLGHADCGPGSILVRTLGGVTSQPFRSDSDLAPGGDGAAEGTAVLEVVHRVAPGATLWFANAGTALELLEAIKFLAPNVDVIVSDIIAHTYFPDGRNLVAQGVADILAERRTRSRAFVQAAGNLARAHYAGRFVDSGTSDGIGRMHLFAARDGTEGPRSPSARNGVSVPPSTTIAVFLTVDRADSVTRHRLVPFDCRSGSLLDPGTEYWTGSEIPEAFWYTNASTEQWSNVCYAIRRTGPGSFPTMLNVTIADPRGDALHWFNTPASSVLPPDDAPADVAVIGALAPDIVDSVQPYSSRGPTFDGRPLPDVVAPDNLPVSGAGGFRSPFAGTSASAAYVGGLAALLLELNPELSLAELRAVVRETAIRIGDENVAGAGRVEFTAAADRALAVRGKGAGRPG